MRLLILNNIFAVCKLKDLTHINLKESYTFLAQTDEEISYICNQKNIPTNAYVIEKNWNMLKIMDILDFGMIGIIAKISQILAQNNISIFVISTYNTDYFLVKSKNLAQTIELLKKNNYQIINEKEKE